MTYICNCERCGFELPDLNAMCLCPTPGEIDSSVIINNNLLRADRPSQLQGIKYDKGKVPLSLLTKESLEYEARALEYGANKYGRDNYKNGMAWSRVIDAALRHLTAFNHREENDAESGLNHLAHAKACLAMLIYYYEHNVGEDDRSKL